jgi:hypothetical protein
MKEKAKYRSSLFWKFDFKEEVPRKNFGDVKKRLELNTSNTYDSPLVQKLGSQKILYSEDENRPYFAENKYNISKFYCTSIDNAYTKINFEINSNLRKLTLEIKAKSKSDVKISDFLNIEKIKDFVINGDSK